MFTLKSLTVAIGRRKKAHARYETGQKGDLKIGNRIYLFRDPTGLPISGDWESLVLRGSLAMA
jgi:hypothetical protein